MGDDPAAYLSTYLRHNSGLHVSSDQQTELDLRSAGLADPSQLRWRDVGVIGLLGDRKPSNFIGQLPATERVMVTLFDRWIAEIRETPPGELEDFLDSRVVGTR